MPNFSAYKNNYENVFKSKTKRQLPHELQQSFVSPHEYDIPGGFEEEQMALKYDTNFSAAFSIPTDRQVMNVNIYDPHNVPHPQEGLGIYSPNEGPLNENTIRSKMTDKPRDEEILTMGKQKKVHHAPDYRNLDRFGQQITRRVPQFE